jgi:hypothetical protein
MIEKGHDCCSRVYAHELVVPSSLVVE